MVIAITLAAFALIGYGPDLGLEFIGDDYVFLDHTVHADFTDLWSRRNTDFGWYRPWSREFHFWALSHLAGVRPVAFRIAGLALWLAGLLLFYAFLSRFAPRPVPALAAIGVSTLALWGTPLLWISGSQDLWLLFFAMLTLLGHASGRHVAATLAFGLALLSKETAAILPVILLSYSLIVDRASLRLALKRAAGPLTMLAAWLLLHPTLRSRLLAGSEHAVEMETRPSPVTVLLRSAGAHFNLDVWPRPEVVDSSLLFQALASSAAAAIGVWLAFRPVERDPSRSARPSRRLLCFGAAWAIAGWVPLALPSIGWHAYYGCLGVLGAWLMLAWWLSGHRLIAVALVASLAVLRTAHSDTPSWDWGSAWYQRRAGVFVTAIREEIRRRHPTLPKHSRVFFGRIPNNIGLVAGRSPAIRIWYADPSLSADFYSNYEPRGANEPRGQDYFFRFDTTRVLVEVTTDSSDPAAEARESPSWVEDHEKLALLFLEKGDVRGAARQFELISRLPDQARSGLRAAACWRSVGEDARARVLMTVASTRLRMSGDEVEREVAALRLSMPGPG